MLVVHTIDGTKPGHNAPRVNPSVVAGASTALINMSSLLQFLKSLLPVVESQQERDEVYLAGAVDICDLERRMREIDDRGRRHPLPVTLLVYAR